LLHLFPGGVFGWGFGKNGRFLWFFVDTTWWNRGENVVFCWSQIRFENCANFLNFIFCVSDAQVYGACAWVAAGATLKSL
jgi:hypothetical protein